MTRALSSAELAQRRAAPLRHGADSPRQVAAKARNHKRRILRRIGVRASDLDAVTLELLNHYARGCAQLDLREAGGVDAGRDYWVAFNGTRRALEKLERRLATLGLDRRGADPLDALAALRRAGQ